MTTRSTRATMAKLLAVLLAFTLFAAACGDDGGEVAETDDVPTDADDVAGQNDETGDADFGTDDDPDTETTEPSPEDVPVRGGTLRVGVEAETDGLNPTSNNFAVSAYIMGYPIFDPLFYFDQDGNWFPWLAETATPSADFMSWDIKVREGILFHDGTELNAAALQANFETAITDPIISLAIVPSYPPENRTEVIDEYTLRYNLIRPNQHFPVGLSSQLGMVASADYLAAAAAEETLNQAPIGTGPYVLVDRDQDNVTVLERNENYWRGTDDLHLDRIEIYINTDTAIAAEQLGTDELDVVITSNPDATLTARGIDGVSTLEGLYSGEDFAMMNTSKPPFDDIRARQALTFATDREGYLTFIAQDTKPLADSMYHPDLKWNNPDVVQEGNMPELAAPLVADYCADVPEMCNDGKINMELQFSGPSVTQTRIMDLLEDGWQDYFNITRDLLPQDQHIIQTATGQWEVVTWRQFGAVDPDNEVVWLECATATGVISLNWPKYCDERRDELLFEQRATDDEARRIAIMQEIQADMNAAYTYIFFTHANWTFAIQDDVRNLCGQTGPGPAGAEDESITLQCNNQGRSFFHNVWLEDAS